MKKFSEFNRVNQWDLPENIDPERVCVCFEIPNDPLHIRAFWTALYKLTLWNSWAADDAHTGTKVAAVWRDVWNRAIGDANTVGCGCNEPEITNRRYNDEWELEVSTDDGNNWSVDYSSDPRFSGAFAPPIAGEDGDDKKCVAAASARMVFEQDFLDAMQEGDAYTALYALLLAIAIPLVGLGAPPLAAVVAGLIMAFTIAALKAAMTPEVLEIYECILYCNMAEDASFDEARWKQVRADIVGQISGIAGSVLWHWVGYIGLVGLTNSARSLRATENDCDDCNCGNCSNLENWSVVFGTIIEQSPGYLKIQSELVGANQAVRIATGDIDTCCYVVGGAEVGGGAFTNTAYYPCGSNTPINSIPPGGSCGHDYNWTNIFGVPFVMEITFTDCP